jgi:hypothetical protein
LDLGVGGCDSALDLGGFQIYITILVKELVQDVAVVSVDSGLVQADECLFLEQKVWVDEWSDLLAKVDCLIDCDLGGIFFILLKDECHSLQVFAVVLEVKLQFRDNDFWRMLILANFWK